MKRTRLFVLIASITAALALLVAAGLVSAREPAGEMMTEIYGGLVHTAVGGAVLTVDSVAHELSIANITDSGQDGVSTDLPASSGGSRTFAGCFLSQCGGVAWTLNGEIDGLPDSLGALSLQPQGPKVNLIFTDGFESGNVLLKVFNQGEPAGEAPITAGGLVAQIRSNGAGISLRSMAWEPLTATAQFVYQVDMEDAVRVRVPDLARANFVGDSIHIVVSSVPTSNYTATDDLWFFKAPAGNNISRTVTSLKTRVDGLWHEALSGQMSSDTPAGPLNLFDTSPDPRIVATAWSGCLTCTITADYTELLFFPELGDEVLVAVHGSINGGPEQMLGQVQEWTCLTCTLPSGTVEPTFLWAEDAGTPSATGGGNQVVCVTFPDPAYGSNILVRFVRGSQILLNTVVNNGDCVALPRPMALDASTWLQDANNRLTYEGEMRLQNGNAVTLVVKALQAVNDEATLLVQSYTADFSMDFK